MKSELCITTCKNDKCPKFPRYSFMMRAEKRAAAKGVKVEFVEVKNERCGDRK